MHTHIERGRNKLKKKTDLYIAIVNTMDHRQIILRPNNHSFCLQRKGCLDLIYRVSGTLKYQSEYALLLIEKKALSKDEIQIRLFIRCSAITETDVLTSI